MFTMTKYSATQNKEVWKLKWKFLNWIGKTFGHKQIINYKIVHNDKLTVFKKWQTDNVTQEYT